MNTKEVFNLTFVFPCVFFTSGRLMKGVFGWLASLNFDFSILYITSLQYLSNLFCFQTHSLGWGGKISFVPHQQVIFINFVFKQIWILEPTTTVFIKYWNPWKQEQWAHQHASVLQCLSVFQAQSWDLVWWWMPLVAMVQCLEALKGQCWGAVVLVFPDYLQTHHCTEQWFPGCFCFLTGCRGCCRCCYLFKMYHFAVSLWYPAVESNSS